MDETILNILNIKHLLDDMENELKLNNLNDVQKNIFYALNDLCSSKRLSKFENIEKHTFCNLYSRVTIYRHLNNLIKFGLVKKNGLYYEVN